MGLSMDTAKLEELRQLQTFFNFLTNPQMYKDFLAETKTVLEGIDQKIAIYATVEEAEKYLEAARIKMAEVNQAVADFNAQLQASAEASALAHAQSLEEVAAAQDALAAQRAQLEADQKELQEQYAAQAQRLQDTIKREQAVSIKESQLAAEEKRLAETKAKLTAALG